MLQVLEYEVAPVAGELVGMLPVMQMPDHRAQFDMLRGTAAMAVLIAHAMQVLLARLLGPEHTAMLIAETVARHAVLVFFLLSGHLITQSIVANLRRNGELDVVSYLSARLARIYPPLIGSILVVLAVWAVIHGLGLHGSVSYRTPGDLYVAREAFAVTASDVMNALLIRGGMLEANGPLWTLYIEARLYVAAMLIAMAGPGWRLCWPAGAVALLARWSRTDVSFAFFAVIWTLGAMTAIRPKWPLPIVVPSLGLFALGVVSPRLLHPDDTMSPWISYGVQFAFCLAYAAVMFRREIRSPAILARTGDFSYSLYLIHYPLLLLCLSLTYAWIEGSIAKSLIVCAGASVVAFFSAALFARFFEDQPRFKPFIRAALRKLQRRSVRSEPPVA